MGSSARETKHALFLAPAITKVNIFPCLKITNNEWLSKTEFFEDRNLPFLE